MKWTYCAIIILSILCAKIEAHPQRNKIAYIHIDFVDFDLLTDVRITCDKFEKAFGRKMISFNIVDPKELLKYSNCINKLVFYKNREPEIDTRVRIKVKYETGDSLLMCMSRNVLVVNNRVVILQGKDNFYTHIYGSILNHSCK
jgi:hypothetical protein